MNKNFISLYMCSGMYSDIILDVHETIMTK